MQPYERGKAAALQRLGLIKAGEENPLIQGVKADTKPNKPPAAPKTPIWPPPPHATSGTALNPKVA